MEKGKKKRLITIVICVILAAILFFGLTIYFSFYGNPVRKLRCKNKALKYVEKTYPGLDVHYDGVAYDFKMGDYFVSFKSDESRDTFFSVVYRGNGEFSRDTYSENVASGWNTFYRVNKEYEDFVDGMMESADMPGNCEIAYGTLMWDELERDSENAEGEHVLDRSILELDKEYDAKELGKEYGHLVIYAQGEEVASVKAAEILLEIKKYLEEKGVTFYDVDFVLEYFKPEEERKARPEGEVRVENFPTSMIYEEGLVERMTNWGCIRKR